MDRLNTVTLALQSEITTLSTVIKSSTNFHLPGVDCHLQVKRVDKNSTGKGFSSKRFRCKRPSRVGNKKIHCHLKMTIQLCSEHAKGKN